MKRLTTSEINVYPDGAMTEADRRDREDDIPKQWENDDGDAAAMLNLHRRHVEELHRLYDEVLSEPIPERMLALLRRKREKDRD